ncbi:MAG: hypothetical protein M5U31_14485 [Acidimicrobiia bacterium]|nr:hypothetical protein [Acidimicrobiia bacterium]
MSGVRRSAGSSFVVVGLLLATIAWSALVLRLTVLDASRLADSAEEVLRANEVRKALGGRLEEQLAPVVPLEAGTPEFAAVTDATLDDPRFISAFSASLVALHDRVFQGSESSLILDPGAVGAASSDSLAAVDPSLAAQVPADLRPDVPLTTIDDLPNLSWLSNLVTAVAILGGIGAVVLLTLGVTTTPHRRVPLRRIGRFALVLAAVQLLVALLVPSLLLLVFDGGWPEVGIRAWRAFAWGLVIPAAALGFVGAASLVIARSQARSPAHPAAAHGAPSAPEPRASGKDRVRNWVWPDD